ncbi:MAG: lysophospholipid acyltransferase family protein [bacterium]
MKWILFYKTTSFLARILPRKIALFITERLAEGAYFVAFNKARPIAMKNLSFALKGLKTEHEVRFMILEQFKNFAGFIYDFLLLPYLDEHELGSMYEMVGFQKVREALKAGKGVIVVTGHLGNWELGASALVQEKVPVTAVVMPHPTAIVTRFFDSTRLSRGVNVVPVDRAARVGLRALRANECLAILGDRDFTGTGTEIDFLGARAVFPVGAMRLAAKAGAAVCPAFAIRSRNGKYKIYFEDTFTVGKLADGSPDVKGALDRWAGILGKYIRLFPTQWYLFEPAWPTK